MKCCNVDLGLDVTLCLCDFDLSLINALFLPAFMRINKIPNRLICFRFFLSITRNLQDFTDFC